VVPWRLRYKLCLRDLAEIFLIRGIVFNHQAVRAGKPSSRRRWPRLCAAADAARLGGAGTSTRPTSKSKAAGAISIAPSTPQAHWWTSG
jgi:hypothetical protein